MNAEKSKVTEAFEQTASTIGSLLSLVELLKKRIDALERRIEKIDREK